MTKFYFTKSQVSPGIHLNTSKYNVWGIKLETKVMRLQKIQVEKISSFFLISMVSITFDNYLFCIKFSQFDMFTEMYHHCILYISESIYL